MPAFKFKITYTTTRTIVVETDAEDQLTARAIATVGSLKERLEKYNFSLLSDETKEEQEVTPMD